MNGAPFAPRGKVAIVSGHSLVADGGMMITGGSQACE